MILLIIVVQFDVFHFQVVAVSVGLVSVAIGIGIPVFYESQIDSAVCVSEFQCSHFSSGAPT